MIEKYEVVEVCPHCDSENVLQWNCEELGFVTRCKYCGEELMLCDECLHCDDNLGQNCDWRKTQTGGICFRGQTTYTEG